MALILKIMDTKKFDNALQELIYLNWKDYRLSFLGGRKRNKKKEK